MVRLSRPEPTPPNTVNLGSVELSIHPPPTSSAVAQSANQVLSEVLSNPPQVLSATDGPPTTPDSLGSSKRIDGLARQATEPLADRPGSRSPWCAAVGGRVGAGGSEPGPPSTAPSPPAGSPDAVTTLFSTCSGDAQRWQAVPVDGVTAAATGSGPATVVLLNDSGNSVCGWLPLADPSRAHALGPCV